MTTVGCGNTPGDFCNPFTNPLLPPPSLKCFENPNQPLYDNKKPKKTGNYLIDKLNAEREASRTSSVTSRVTPLYEDRSALPPPLADQPLQPHEKRLVNLPSTESQRDQAALRGTELERELMESENYVSKDFGAKAAADKNKVRVVCVSNFCV